MNKCVVMDIDGTLANAEHRIHLLPVNRRETGVAPSQCWEEFFAEAGSDEVIEEIKILNNLMFGEYTVFACTGRAEKDRQMTVEWLEKHEIQFDFLFMRADGDHRKDTEVKKEMLDRIRSLNFEPLFAVEDRKSVTQMWRENGVRCLQVCEGDY